jgi:restriction system protein
VEDNLAKPTAWSLKLLQNIEWKRFEDLCAAFYKEKGIRCETTPLGADGGVDIRLFQDANTPQATAVVQCKAWGEKQVGVKPIRELLGVMTHEKIGKSFFMAPGGFTDDAREFAQANRITLLDGKLFLSMLERLPAEARQKLLAFATSGDYTTPSCPSCGDKMRRQSGSRGDFWSCRNYPRCRQTLPMRKSAS